MNNSLRLKLLYFKLVFKIHEPIVYLLNLVGLILFSFKIDNISDFLFPFSLLISIIQMLSSFFSDFPELNFKLKFSTNLGIYTYAQFIIVV